MASVTRLVYRLGRELRYRALPELVGQRIAVGSIDAIEPALRALAAAWLPPDARWHARAHLAGALAKYGLVDAQLDAPRALLDHPSTQVGLPVLRAHGMVPPRGERWDDLARELEGVEELAGLDTYCLERLVDNLDARRCVLKLFLRDDVPDDVHQQWLLAAARAGHPLALRADYFPRELAVIDACITNADSIWFNTHFYM